jgi:hypothetical protein
MSKAMIVGEGPVQFVESTGLEIEERPFHMGHNGKDYAVAFTF